MLGLLGMLSVLSMLHMPSAGRRYGGGQDEQPAVVWERPEAGLASPFW